MAAREHRPKGPYYHASIQFTEGKPERCRCNYEDYITAEDPTGKTGALAAVRAFVAGQLDSPRLKWWKIMNQANYVLWSGE